MLLHGVENPDIRYRDSLAQDHAGEERDVHAGPRQPAVRRRRSTTRPPPRTCSQVVKTKKTELLFLALFLRLLKPGGRAAVIVPDGVLFGSSKAHKELRRILVEDQKLDARRQAARRRVQALRRRLDRDPAVHQDQLRRHRPRLVLRRARPTAGASTTSARRCCPRTSSARCRRRADRGRAREEQPARRARPLGRARRRRTRAPAHRAELLRAQGRHRRHRATTSRSTATRKSSTSESSTARRWRSSPTWRSWRRRFSRG